MPAITPTVEFGLGGSFIAQALATTTFYKFWAMRVINSDLSIDQSNDALASPPAGWSSGDSLSLVGTPLINQPTDLPEGGSSVRLNGTSQYLASVYDETLDLSDIGPQSLEVVVTIHAVPGAGDEPAVVGGSTEFAVTARDDGRLYGYYNGAAVVDLPFTVDTPLHVVLTRSDGSPDTIRLYVNNAIDAATPANGTINRGFVHLGKHWSAADYLEATYSFAAFYAVEMTGTQVLAHYNATLWTDVTQDTNGTTPMVIETGVRDDGPLSRVASTGTCTFALKNAANQPKLIGYYSPGHANVRAGFTRGIPVRVRVNDGADDVVQFLGRLRTIAPAPGKTTGLITRCLVTDIIDDIARFRLNQIPILEDVRGDAVFRSLVERLPNQPHGLETSTGSETYDLALDNTRDEQVTMLQECVRLAHSERGRIYISRIGTLVYENRYARVLDHFDPVVTLADSMVGLEVAEVTADAINRVEVTVHPREVDDDPTTVLFALVNPLQIEPGETQQILGPFRIEDAPDKIIRVGGLDLQAPVSGTDYLMNAADDGSGTDLTASLTVVANYGANGVSYTLTNTGAVVGHVTRLQARGRGVYDFRTVVVFAEDEVAIAADGLNPIQLDMPYQEDPRVGQAAADAWLAAYGGLTSRARTVTILPHDDDLPAGVMALDISDRIALSETVTGINDEFYINGRRFEYQNGQLAKLTFWLAPTVEDDTVMAWQDVTYNAANFTASSGTWTVDLADQTLYRWTRQGPDAMVIAFRIAASDVSAAAADLRIAIPGGFLAAQTGTAGHFRYRDANGAAAVGFIGMNAGLGYLALVKAADVAWTITVADNTLVSGTTCPFEIQT